MPREKEDLSTQEQTICRRTAAQYFLVGAIGMLLLPTLLGGTSRYQEECDRTTNQAINKVKNTTLPEQQENSIIDIIRELGRVCSSQADPGWMSWVYLVLFLILVFSALGNGVGLMKARRKFNASLLATPQPKSQLIQYNQQNSKPKEETDDNKQPSSPKTYRLMLE